jgi:Tfp pilus assembly protein PilF
LEHANAALQRDRLLFPESDSAVSYYRRILEHDAQHSEAVAGMERIVERYLALARSAFDRREFERADRLIDRALRVSPNHAGSLALRRQVADTRAEQQAEAERQRQADATRLAAETAARAEAARLAAAAEAAREAELARRRSSLDDLLWWQN